jgi:hypothetical protein
VTGAVALYAAANPGATAAQIKAAILNSTRATSSLAGRTVTGGRLDIGALMGAAAGPTFSIGDVTLDEGDNGAADFTFTVTLSAPSAQAVSVQYATANGTAGSGDYTPVSLTTLSFAPNETSKPVTVSVSGDTTSEANETFLVNLSNASGASIADGQAVGIIRNDDGLLSVNDVTKAEGNSGVTAFTFTVSLQNASTKTVTVDYATADGSAGSGDYAALPLTTLSFAPGETSKSVTVNVNGDLGVEPNETFFLNLSNAGNAALADNQGVGTIVDDDNAPGLSINDVSRTEGNFFSTSFTFTVSLAFASTQTVTVRFATANGTATSSGSTRDYNATSGTLTFSPGQTSRTVTVTVRGDFRVEGNETFFVNLSNPTNAVLLDNQGLGTILNND